MERRKFLKTTGAGLAAGAAAAPGLATAQGKEQTFRWKLQSANPAGTPHMDLLNRFASNVDRMSGGRLKIEVLPVDAVVAYNETHDSVAAGI